MRKLTLFALLALTVIMLAEAASAQFMVPISITERSGNNLYNYTIKIILNSTNFKGWNYVANNGQDIYFTTASGKPLYYWIEYFNKTEQNAIIWVKVPYIPANSTVTIYMLYGGENPYSSYNDPRKAFLFYDDFDNFDTTVWKVVVGTRGGSVSYGVSNSKFYQQFDSTAGASGHAVYEYVFVYANVSVSPTPGLEMQVLGYEWYCGGREEHTDGFVSLFGDSSDIVGVGHNSWSFSTLPSARVFIGSSSKYVGSQTCSGRADFTVRIWKDGTVQIYVNGALALTGTISNAKFTRIRILLQTDMGEPSAEPFGHRVDKIILRVYTTVEPLVIIGRSVMVTTYTLPPETLYLVHHLVYSPNASQFTHIFSALNESEASYELGVPDAWGWRLYANPGNDVNVATLVSTITITLPYSNSVVDKLTLYARTNATGSYRRLWIKILDSSGNVVAELSNATIGVDWTKVVVPIGKTLQGKVTIWINVTIATTPTSSEEIAIKDVKLHVEYTTNLTVTPFIRPDVEFFDCITSHYVALGSTEYLNESVITFKLIEYLVYNHTEYPVNPVYIGDETIGGHIYKVYRIEPANYSQLLTIHALLENVLKDFETRVGEFSTTTVLAREPLTILLPTVGNVTIPLLNITYINVTKVTIRFTSPGTYVVIATVIQPSVWKLGYAAKVIEVKFGSFNVKPVDMDAKVVTYESLRVQLIDESSGKILAESVGSGILGLDELPAGNYTIRLLFKDIVVAATHFELNITTDNTTITLPCSMRILPSDYRGLNKTIIYEFGKQLVAVKNLSNKFPYSRLTILLNGTGSFKLYIDYRGDLPTAVKVEGNVTGLHYYWLGNYLVVTGVLGSVGEINITDLYRVRVEIYDRLGNYMPSWVYAYINGTKYGGAVIEDYFHPGDYVLTLPASVNGFEFYGFWDGFNETRRNFTVVDSDVNFRVWYRVPTRIEVKPVVVENGTDYVTVYFEGRVVDYYGGGVPNRNVTLIIENKDTGARMMANLTLDADGRFVSPTIELLPGTYTIKVVYNGDDVYVGSSTETTATFTVKTPTPTPVPGPSIEYVLAGVGVLAVLAALASLARIGRRTRFVKASHA